MQASDTALVQRPAPGRRSWVRRLRKRSRQAYLRVLRSPGAPREIAGGLAIGLFVALLPVIQMPIAVGAAALARRLFGIRLSMVAAAAGVWFTNPLTGAPIFGLAFLVGRPIVRLVLPDSWLSSAGTKLSLADLTSAGPFAIEAGASLVLGGVLLGLPIAYIGYKLALRVVARYQARRQQRTRRTVAVA